MGACASAPAPTSASSSASASASSSQVACGKYHVFVSFRGQDVRFGFLSHLKEELRRKNINFYVDDRLERGEEISSALVNAIEVSMIALVIFSKDYASSRWCLDELVKIMKCKEDGQQIVIPVFYLVDPSDVRHQKRTYAKPFTRHKKYFKDKVKIWRSVLQNSANLAGYDSSKFQEESKLIDAIVEGVREKLVYNSPFVPNSQLIGSCQNVTIIESLMEIKSLEVRLVGIWGMGGIGKTTLARDICDRFSPKFERHCFLENVRKKSIDGLNLHDELLSQLLDQNERENNPLKWLRLKKVLIALDDVENPMQIKDLVGRLQLGPGSRVIVTSRDKQVLGSGGIRDQFIHEVNELNSKESLELFCRHSFNQSQPKEGYEKLSQETVDIAQGIPLALVVLGSHFHSRNEAYWESELSELKRYPHEQIQNILKISYDGLDPMDKEIFLDIAFFFVGDKKNNVTCYLKACGFKAISGITNLIDKALIKLDQHICIVMHDLIREMAEQIACGERKRHPEKSSRRLKDANEIYDILKGNKETDFIEGIILDVNQIECVQVEADIFGKMKKLRILKFFSSTLRTSPCMPKIDLPFDLDPFSTKLRYLHWDHYPLETLPSGSYLENLVELHMQNSNVKRLWDGKQDLGNLKTINLRWSKQLIELPDLSMAHKLESVHLQGCKSLDGWSFLSEIPDNIKASTGLECLSLDDSAVETLPAYFNDLSSLKDISLRRCKRLKSILGLPPSLEKLDASECTSLETVPSAPLVQNKCVFNFINCENLDEHSGYIRGLILPSLNSDRGFYYRDEVACYPGSTVPKWMEYQPKKEASNATEFTYNLKRSQVLLFCCVAPHLASQRLNEVYCSFSCVDKDKFHISRKLFYPALNRDHVLLWRVMGSSFPRILDDAKISCEFVLKYWDDEKKVCYEVPANACGVDFYPPTNRLNTSLKVICSAEPYQRRERILCISD